MASKRGFLARQVLAVAVVLAVAAVAGCAARGGRGAEPKPDYAGRLAQYRRLAIVCAPSGGADPAYAGVILDQVERMAPSRLDFLERVDVLRNAAVDTATVPPSVRLKDASAYDGVVVLVYSYDGPVVMDMFLLDAGTREQVWQHRLSTQDKNVTERLRRHGWWTPTTIKQQFYGRD